VARGGAAKNSTASDNGYVADRRVVTPRSAVVPQSPAVATALPPPPPAPKKTPKRQQSIGTAGEPNADQGLAGGSNGSSATGEQASTPTSATP
jgi:hypothetical protein